MKLLYGSVKIYMIFNGFEKFEFEISVCYENHTIVLKCFRTSQMFLKTQRIENIAFFKFTLHSMYLPINRTYSLEIN